MYGDSFVWHKCYFTQVTELTFIEQKQYYLLHSGEIMFNVRCLFAYGKHPYGKHPVWLARCIWKVSLAKVHFAIIQIGTCNLRMSQFLIYISFDFMMWLNYLLKCHTFCWEKYWLCMYPERTLLWSILLLDPFRIVHKLFKKF